MQWPPPLHAQSRIALIAPSRSVRYADVESFLAFAIRHGWEVVYDESLFAHDGVLAGPDAHRLSQLQSALDSADIQAIWFVRGGHGVSRIWKRISWEGLSRYPKWLIGFSDITPLLWGAAKAGVISLHAPVAVQIPYKVSSIALSYLLRILTSESFDFTLSWPWQPWYAWRQGAVSGRLLGGNLSLLQTLCGTALDIKEWNENPILFWEEVGEYVYRIDRLSWHLSNAGWYERAKALLVGGLTNIQDNEDIPFGKSLKEVIWESANTNLPLAMGLPIGHLMNNMPLPVGADASLVIEERRAYLRFWRS
ncbi:MAG: LD-carboxypeptidase [Bacteroidia bacterium]